MITTKDIEDELQKIEEIAPQYAKAVGKTVSDKEHWVAVQPDVTVANEGIANAIHNEEKLRWELKQSELKIEVWRTQQASSRLERML